MPSEYLSASKFAERVGKSKVWICRLVKQGKIPLINNKIPWPEGLEAYKESSDVTKEAVRAANEKNSKQKKEAAPQVKKEHAQHQEQEPEIQNDQQVGFTHGASSSQTAYNKARAAKETFAAKLKELEYKEAKGLLISVSEVKQDAEKLAATVRQKLVSICPGVATSAEGKSSKQIQRIVEDAINSALEDLQTLEGS